MSPLRLTQATALTLLALATGRAHGFRIMEVSGLASGTVYPVLRRLEREGLVASEWEDSESAEAAGRPRRRVYTLTDTGLAWAERARERLSGAQALIVDSTPTSPSPAEGA